MFSSAIKEKRKFNKNNKIVYRINTPLTRITQTGSQCVIWNYPQSNDERGYWSSEDCSVKTEDAVYVECECKHLSEYSVLAKGDDRTGYHLYFYIACIIVMVRFLSVIFCLSIKWKLDLVIKNIGFLLINPSLELH